jgi:hypothetical protein
MSANTVPIKGRDGSKIQTAGAGPIERNLSAEAGVAHRLQGLRKRGREIGGLGLGFVHRASLPSIYRAGAGSGSGRPVVHRACG